LCSLPRFAVVSAVSDPEKIAEQIRRNRIAIAVPTRNGNDEEAVVVSMCIHPGKKKQTDDACITRQAACLPSGQDFLPK